MAHPLARGNTIRPDTKARSRWDFKAIAMGFKAIARSIHAKSAKPAV
jgi:hypothetical protein